MGTTDERKLQILDAIVQDYVATREPVGSKSLLERHDLGVSAATVRSDMSVLEDEGLIVQPHTSAGRVPTDKGYRAFVDHIARIKPLSSPERRAIESFLADAGDLDELLGRTVRLLAQVTHQVAMVQYPLRRQARVRHIELVRLGETMLLLVLITESGRVDQRTISLAAPRDVEFYEALRGDLLRATIGGQVTELDEALAGVVATRPVEDQLAAGEVASALGAMFDERREERIVLAGAGNLARSAADFSREVELLLDVLEEQLVLLRLLGDMNPEPGAVEVRIGGEIRDAALGQAALVGAGYGSGAHLAILGPRRMDYVAGISNVHALARYISRYLQ
ncbi:heat-inducible transcriptional repressor HrcA [Brachybacterium sp. AOP25-B2-12]|uniref:heat-inducible transcriptional repressor HrcA n=1 Tax=Brachybacterium sp. AOP25-B2-12 TaxID=3457710 RepID=UPI00403358BE